MIFREKKHKRTRSVSIRLLNYILLVSSVLTLAITALQLYTDYRKDITIIEDSLSQIKKSYKESIAHHLWNMDAAGLKTQLTGILSIRDIIYAEVISEDENNLTEISAGEKSHLEMTLQREYPVIYEKSGIYKNLGTFRVAASKKGIIKRIKEKFFLILASQTIKTFIVSIFIVLISNKIITRHLAVMGSYAASLDLGKLDEPLVLKRRQSKNDRLDELDMVVRAINKMRQRLKISYEEIRAKSRIEGELSAAASLQQYVIPAKPPVVEGYEIAFLFMPALEVSGDYFDFFNVDANHTGIVIADASGKGMPASIHINTVRVLLRSRPELHRYPDTMMNIVNSYIKKELPENQFITMGYLLLEKEGITYLCAGHEPAVVCTVDGQMSFIKPSGYPICCVHSDNFENRLAMEKISMNDEDVLVVYTDGATDAINHEGVMLGDEFYELIRKGRKFSAEKLLEGIRTRIVEYQGSTGQNDDITIIVIKKNRQKHETQDTDTYDTKTDTGRNL